MRLINKTLIIFLFVFISLGTIGGCGGGSGKDTNNGIEELTLWQIFVDCNVERGLITEMEARQLIEPTEVIFEEKPTCGTEFLARGCLIGPLRIHLFAGIFDTLEEETFVRFHEYWHSIQWQLKINGPNGDALHEGDSWTEEGQIIPEPGDNTCLLTVNTEFGIQL